MELLTPMFSEVTNLQRACWADRAIRAFMAETGTELEDSLCDLLCDLMHWANAKSFDFDTALDRARDHYRAELIEEGGD